MTEFAIRHRIPVDATRGGAETMYPDFRVKMRSMPLPPAPPPAPAQQRRTGQD
jgi:hypothetical protein